MISALIAVALALAAPGVAATHASEKPAKGAPREESPEAVAKDAQRDLKDTRFYNRPGATRADYDKAWQECRLIARGSRTPSGTYTYFYNPNYISPVAAGVGAGIGAAIGQAIVQGQMRRANRRTCLLVRGWRLVEVEPAEATRVTAMSDEDRSHYFDGIVGATDVHGRKVIEWTNSFAAPQLATEGGQ